MESESKVFCSKQTYMEVTHEHSHKSCADSCNAKWLNWALEVLQENNIYPPYFSAAVQELLQMGHANCRNILIIGRTNCPKTFLLRPLELFFDTFCTPTTNKYAWIGLDGKKVIFLNDIWWSSELIPWETFLVLLGEVVHFPLPKTSFQQRTWLSLLMFLYLPLQSQGLSILMILLKLRLCIPDERYLNFPIKYCHFNKRIWHHVPNAFVIWFAGKNVSLSHVQTSFVWFNFVLIYLTYS